MRAGIGVERMFVLHLLPIFVISANDPNAQRSMHLQQDVRDVSESSPVSGERIAGDYDDVGLFIIENVEHAAFTNADAVSVQIAELRDSERRGDVTLYRRVNYFDAERLDPDGIGDDD